jgi:hypothetical protein
MGALAPFALMTARMSSSFPVTKWVTSSIPGMDVVCRHQASQSPGKSLRCTIRTRRSETPGRAEAGEDHLLADAGQERVPDGPHLVATADAEHEAVEALQQPQHRLDVSAGRWGEAPGHVCGLEATLHGCAPTPTVRGWQDQGRGFPRDARVRARGAGPRASCIRYRDRWTEIRDSASALIGGGASLYALASVTGNLLRYDGAPGNYTQIGGPRYQLVAGTDFVAGIRTPGRRCRLRVVRGLTRAESDRAPRRDARFVCARPRLRGRSRPTGPAGRGAPRLSRLPSWSRPCKRESFGSWTRRTSRSISPFIVRANPIT